MNMQIHRNTPNLAVFDARGLPARRVDYLRAQASDVPLAQITRQAHDAAARIVAQWDPRLIDNSVANLRSVYSLSGIPLGTDNVDAGWRVELYGEAGQPLYRWDQRGSQQQTDYDRQLRPIAIHEQGNGQIALTVERLTYGGSLPGFASHNQCGQLVEHHDPAGRLSIDDYSLAGAPLHQTRRFLKSLERPDWPESGTGQENLLEPAHYETLWRYNAVGDTLDETNAKGHTQHIAQDIAGQLKTVHLQWAGSADKQPIVHSLQYNASGQVESQTTGNGVISAAVFDPANGNLSELKASKGSTTCQHLSYRYEAMNNVIAITDHLHVTRFFANQRIDGLREFTYDTLSRLRSATGLESMGASTQPQLPGLIPPGDPTLLGNYSQSYEYDPGGNLTKLTHTSPTPGQGHTLIMGIAPLSNRCLSWRKGQSAPELGMNFDDDGNLLTLQPGDQPLTWTLRNQLQGVIQVCRTNAEDDVERYVYDAQGNRVRKWQSTQAASVTHVREVRYLPGLEIRTLDATEELHVCTLQAGRSNVRGLHWIMGKPAEIEQRQLRYSLDDHLGSCTLELDNNARLISHEGYYPFGGTAWWAANSQVQADYKTIRYSGKERDASGLYHYGFRYYAPWIMRWLNPDPAGPVDGLNLYAMVGNNPLGVVDRLGLVITDAQQYVRDRTTSIITSNEQYKFIPQAKTPKKKLDALRKLHEQEYPDFIYTKSQKQKLVAHAGGEYSNTDPEHTVIASDHFNIPHPSGISSVPGVELFSDHQGHDFRTFKINDPGKLKNYLTDKYSAYYDQNNTAVKVYKGVSQEPVNTSDVLKERSASALAPEAWNAILDHIQQNNYLIPEYDGLPGAHAETVLRNTVSLLRPTTPVEQEVLNIWTFKIQGTIATQAFPACTNCTGILRSAAGDSLNIDVQTGYTDEKLQTWRQLTSDLAG
ncbi:insecticidal toxin complex protein TccC [Pseudomonas sp. Tn43]|uniref:RHS repeat-associated core domain-containing protein n=1 Tax=Pseudomonas sp. Tn43 TaxID=701213 RepID=UPI00160C78E3|nr:RHS repeat protein [Pseudomonas sp. Tn43]MBB3242327.1 insecticidal toxin complex protein TccC [Pseudomonas sp. Tn43]